MRIAPRSLGKAAVAAGSAVLLLGIYGDTTSAASAKPADLLPCDSLGDVLPPVGQICSTVDSALPSLPVPTPEVPSLPLPELPSLPLPELPVPGVGDLPLPAAAESAAPAAADSPAVPGLPTLPVPVPELPSLGVIETVVPTVIGAIEPVVNGVQSALPAGALPELPIPRSTAPSLR